MGGKRNQFKIDYNHTKYRGLNKEHLKCKVEGCDTYCAQGHKGYCERHYMQIYRYGRIIHIKPYKTSIKALNRECIVKGCHNIEDTKELCSIHYRRLRDHGTVKSINYINGICEVSGCKKKAIAKGFCNMHYRNIKKNSIIKLSIRDDIKVCMINNCNNEPLTNGLCKVHDFYYSNNLSVFGSKTFERNLTILKLCNRYKIENGYISKIFSVDNTYLIKLFNHQKYPKSIGHSKLLQVLMNKAPEWYVEMIDNKVENIRNDYSEYFF